MDKSTLSNYGWIVIAVLVLSVMIALATPFGNYIKDATVNTLDGLMSVSDNALGIVGMSTKPHQPQANDGIIEYGVGDPDLNPTGVDIIDGVYNNDAYTYYVISTGNELGASTLEEAKEVIKQQCEQEIGITWEEYIAFLIQEGEFQTEDEVWLSIGLTKETFEPYVILGYKVEVNIKYRNQTSFGPILESINGKPITSMVNTFKNCTNLATAPQIPNSVTNMSNAFIGCTSLTTAPTIPSGVIDMSYTFKGCSSLVDASNLIIPSSVENLKFTFIDCTSLTRLPIIKGGMTSLSLYQTFAGCTSLTDLSDFVIPNGVIDMYGTFASCSSLVDASNLIISNGVTDMSYTFSDCTNLTTAPIIPSSVTSMWWTFENCKSLTVAPEIPNGVTTSEDVIFKGCRQFGY